MGGFLGNDSAFGRLMAKCGNIILLNIFFIITCIPFLTIGAAAAAMYHTVFALLDEDNDSGVFTLYVQGLRRHFLRATLVWLAFAGIMALGTVNLRICAVAGGWLNGLAVGVIAVMTAAVIITVYLLPVLTRFSGRLRELVKLSICVALGHPLQMVWILLVNVGPLMLLYFDEANRPTYAFAGTFFWFGLIASLVGKKLMVQFAPYLRMNGADGCEAAAEAA